MCWSISSVYLLLILHLCSTKLLLSIHNVLRASVLAAFPTFIAEEMESQRFDSLAPSDPAGRWWSPACSATLGEHSLPRSCLVRTLKPKWEGIFSGLFQRLYHMKEKKRDQEEKEHRLWLTIKLSFQFFIRWNHFFPSKNNFWLILRLVASFRPVNTRIYFFKKWGGNKWTKEICVCSNLA